MSDSPDTPAGTPAAEHLKYIHDRMKQIEKEKLEELTKQSDEGQNLETG